MAKQKLLPLFDKGSRVSDLFFDQKTEIVYLRKAIGGKKIKFTTRTKRDQVHRARRIANEKLRELLGHRKIKITPLVKDEMASWLLVKQAEGLDPATYQKINQAKKRIEGFWGSRYPSDINRDTAAEWINWLAKEYPGQQKFTAIKYMRNFCRYLAEKGHLPLVPKITDPDAKKNRTDRAKRKGRIFTAEEFKKIYRAGNQTEKVIALFMYTMGTRIDETLKLRFGRELLFLEKPVLYVWSAGQNKMDLSGKHALHPAVVKFIHQRSMHLQLDGALLFPQKFNREKPMRAQMIKWADWRKRANLGWHWTSHTFRHTCLSNLFNDSKNPQALICKLYRVSLGVALDVYVKPTKEGIEQMRTAIEVKL